MGLFHFVTYLLLTNDFNNTLSASGQKEKKKSENDYSGPTEVKAKLSLISHETEFDPKYIISEFTSSIPWNPLTLNVRISAVIISKNIILNKWKGDKLKTPQEDGNELQYIFYNADENNLGVIFHEIWKH